MSWKHVQLVLESTRYKGPTKGVLLALTCHLNAKRIKSAADYEVWPGKKTLIRISGWGETTVEKAIRQLAKDGVVEILQVGVGKETSHYKLHLDKLVDRDAAQGGPGDDPQWTAEQPTVGRVATPNREVKPGIEKRTVEPEQLSTALAALSCSFKTTAKEQHPNLRGFAPEPPPGVSPAGPQGDDEMTRHSLRSSPSSVSPHAAIDDIWKVGELMIVLMNLEESWDRGAASNATEDYFKQNPDTDPFVLGHHMVWAFAKSNYWGKTLINPPEFYDHYDLIARQYEKFYSEREEKSRPERVWPTLKKLLAYRIKKQKEETTATVAAPMGDGRPVEIDEL